MTALPQKPNNSRGWRDTYYHRLLGLKAAQRVERILPLFEQERPDDERPRRAIAVLRAWAEGNRELSMPEVRRLSLAAHAAAKEAVTEAAKCVAHAAGQAVGTWHVPTHALGAFEYAGRAFILKRLASGTAPKRRPRATDKKAEPGRRG
ncbi:MAG TPA: hypothetical protein PLI51_00180 [bacterium]|nr:hypothetical protein [bacterium]HPQ65128.1 hypothetical protein [bacterium]